MTASAARNVIPMVHPRARGAYRRGMEEGYRLASQATQRVRWTFSVKAKDALILGLAVGLLAGVAIGQWVLR